MLRIVRRVKYNKKFKPATVDAGDELYPNGIFVFNITKMIVIKMNPEKFPVEVGGS